MRKTTWLHLHPGSGPLYNEKNIAPGAQTESPGDAGPVNALLGGEGSPADFIGVRSPESVVRSEDVRASTMELGSKIEDPCYGLPLPL